MAAADLIRAQGRSLEDFGELSSAERELLDCCRRGEAAAIESEVPEERTDGNYVRADFVRFLALGGDACAPVHERGVHLEGAWLEEPLDLIGVTIDRPLLLINCRIELVAARHCHLSVTSLAGSRLLNGFLGDGLSCEGGLYLRNGFHVTGEVRLVGATVANLDFSGGRFERPDGVAIDCCSASISQSAYCADGFSAVGMVSFRGAAIGGDLSCDGGCFEANERSTLDLENAKIRGSLFLRNGCHVTGETSLLGVTVGGQVNCEGGRFENPGADALTCDRAEIRGSFLMRKGFQASGSVRLNGATINGNLECTDGQFSNPDGISLLGDGMTVRGSVHLRANFRSIGAVQLVNATILGDLDCSGAWFTNDTGDALLCERARAGSFFFCKIEAEKLAGSVRLSATHVTSLRDDLESWKGANGRVVLDGFTYERLADASPTDAQSRITWLGLQKSAHLAHDFRPQPWEQLISVLRAMGHAEEARTLAIAKHGKMREAGRYVGGSPLWDRIYGGLVGYGYRPWKLLTIVAIIWAIGSLAYWAAVNPQWFGSTTHLIAPTAPEPSPGCLATRVGGRTREPCPPARPAYRDFFAPAYSFEVLLPAVSLNYKEDWQPVVRTADGRPLLWGWLLYLLYWFQIVFGWLAGLLLIGAVGQLIKKD